MAIKEQVLEMLERNRGKAFSGEELAEKLGVSRTSVWKAVNSLRLSGYEIKAVTNNGYCLELANDIISPEGIKAYLCDNLKNLEVIYKEETTSTNEDLMKLAQIKGHKTTVEIASSQTSGRGRIGRTFVSPNGGIYLSVLLDFNNTALNNVTIVTPMVAVAVCRVIERFTQKQIGIKWVNDLYLDGKKICGILTQASIDIENATTSTIVVGIGLDYKIDTSTYPLELQKKAGTLLEINEYCSYTKNQIIASLINEILSITRDLYSRSFMSEYRNHSVVIGKEITYEYNKVKHSGIVKDISNDGALIVKEKEKTVVLTSGEISINTNGEWM